MTTAEQSKPTETGYVMGHTDRERCRLSLQAAVLNPLGTQLFSLMQDAGLPHRSVEPNS